jgi:hypothetical protein
MALSDLHRALIYGESELGRGRDAEGVQQHLSDHECCERRDRACGWTERGDDQSARRCDSTISAEDHHVNMH